MRELTDLESSILSILANHRGVENRIKRADMLRVVNMALKRRVTDRKMRAAIEQLRSDHLEGAFICSTTDGGYYRARNTEELNAYLKQDEKRAKMILSRISRQRQRATTALTQTPLPMRGGV
jgi:hypothetical protein